MSCIKRDGERHGAQDAKPVSTSSTTTAMTMNLRNSGKVDGIQEGICWELVWR